MPARCAGRRSPSSRPGGGRRRRAAADAPVEPSSRRPSVDQRPAGEPEEDVLEGAAAHQRRDRLEPALVHLGDHLVAVVAVDEQPVGQHLDPVAEVG